VEPANDRFYRIHLQLVISSMSFAGPEMFDGFIRINQKILDRIRWCMNAIQNYPDIHECHINGEVFCDEEATGMTDAEAENWVESDFNTLLPVSQELFQQKTCAGESSIIVRKNYFFFRFFTSNEIPKELESAVFTLKDFENDFLK